MSGREVPRDHLGITLILAIAAHAVGAGFMLLRERARVIETPETPASIAEETELDLVANDDGARRSPLAMTDRSADTSQRSEPSVARRASTSLKDVEVHELDRAPGNEDPAPYSVSPLAPGGRAERRVDLAVGDGDWSRWTDVSAPARPRGASSPELTRPSPPPVSSTGGLAEALEAHDQELGLGPAGAVLSVARESGYSEVAPAVGTATFSVTVLGTGAVQVSLLGATSNLGAWQQVGDRIAAGLAKKPPHISESRKGFQMGLELAASERWPNGSLAQGEPAHLDATLGSIKATDQSQAELERRNPFAIAPPGSPVDQPPLKANVELPGFYVKGRGKICSYAIGLTVGGLAITGGCDPSNIGAKPIRVVSTRVLSQSML